MRYVFTLAFLLCVNAATQAATREPRSGLQPCRIGAQAPGVEPKAPAAR